jgi:hypothetical protein
MKYDGFKLFMNAYLGNDISDDLCQHLFSTFCKQIPINNATITSLQQAEAMIADKPGIILETVYIYYTKIRLCMRHALYKYYTVRLSQNS